MENVDNKPEYIEVEAEKSYIVGTVAPDIYMYFQVCHFEKDTWSIRLIVAPKGMFHSTWQHKGMIWELKDECFHNKKDEFLFKSRQEASSCLSKLAQQYHWDWDY